MTKAVILIAINFLIVLATEFSGTLFFENGVIHIIALFFVVATAVPLARNYYLADPILKKFLVASIFAFLLFAASHISEFFQYKISGGYPDHIFAITVNFYLMSIFLMIFGSEIFLRAHSGYRHSRVHLVLTGIALAVLLLISFFFSIYPEIISLAPENLAPYAYGVAALMISFILWRRLVRLGNLFSKSLVDFFRYLQIMLIFVVISMIFNIFYEFMEEGLGIPAYEIVYFSHFFFYGGLSVMFLAFEDLLKIGGVFKDIRERRNNNKLTS
ncbi:MAG: hypothetical protein HYT21_00570 [Candidatus Nealsonbacteria bacterium]|nr:hypothetical protein [Candidatus Nealsonbacteria bacterium]